MVIYIYICVCMCKCIFDDFRDSGRQATYSYQISSLSACGPSAGLVGHRWNRVLLTPKPLPSSSTKTTWCWSPVMSRSDKDIFFRKLDIVTTHIVSFFPQGISKKSFAIYIYIQYRIEIYKGIWYDPHIHAGIMFPRKESLQISLHTGGIKIEKNGLYLSIWCFCLLGPGNNIMNRTNKGMQGCCNASTNQLVYRDKMHVEVCNVDQKHH